MEIDRISNLPEYVLDQILSKLWIKDAVKTSVLSTTWRYKYATHPNLEFDDSLIPNQWWHKQPDTATGLTSKVVSVIDRVLMLHSGPINKFRLSVWVELPTDEIEKWILFVSRRNPKVFVFVLKGFDVSNPFRVPSSMFSCQSLTDLELSYSSLEPPTTFKGFKNLKRLSLRWGVFSKKVLENLISDSPVLEILELFGFRDIDNLRVDAPHMQRLTFFGGLITRLSLENTPNLTVFSVDSIYLGADHEDIIYFKKLLAGMPQIQRLDFGSHYLHWMTAGDVHEEIPVSLVKLHQLSIKVNFNKFIDNLYFIYLLNCAPNLQELQIRSMCYWESSSNSWEHENTNGPFTHLRYLKLDRISGSKAEMDFISFMLLTSPALETMAIDLLTSYRANQENITEDQVKVEVLKQLLLFSRASPNVKIIIS